MRIAAIYSQAQLDLVLDWEFDIIRFGEPFCYQRFCRDWKPSIIDQTYKKVLAAGKLSEIFVPQIPSGSTAAKKVREILAPFPGLRLTVGNLGLLTLPNPKTASYFLQAKNRYDLDILLDHGVDRIILDPAQATQEGFATEEYLPLKLEEQVSGYYPLMVSWHCFSRAVAHNCHQHCAAAPLTICDTQEPKKPIYRIVGNTFLAAEAINTGTAAPGRMALWDYYSVPAAEMTPPPHRNEPAGFSSVKKVPTAKA